MSSRVSLLRFRVGLVLLLANVPVGYGGLAAGGTAFAKTGKALWIEIGSGIYALSWVMAGVGLLMSGTEGVRLAKELWGRGFRRKVKGGDTA